MYSICIADDEKYVLKSIAQRISSSGMELEVVGMAGNGLEALELYDREQPDIFFVDINMPVVNGLDFIERIRKKAPDVRTRFIIISGYDDFEYARQAIEVGVDQYLLKPVTRMKLKNVLLELKDKIEQDQEQEDYRTQFQNEIQEYEQFSRRRFMEKILEGELSVKEIYDEAERQSIEITALWQR